MIRSETQYFKLLTLFKRLIGQCERAIELAIVRCTDQKFRPRGKLIGEFDSNIERVAQMRLELDAMRLVVLNAADTMDLLGNKAGKRVIAQAKILIPNTVQRIIDECCQMYGGQGLTQHTPLPVSHEAVQRTMVY